MTFTYTCTSHPSHQPRLTCALGPRQRVICRVADLIRVTARLLSNQKCFLIETPSSVSYRSAEKHFWSYWTIHGIDPGIGLFKDQNALIHRWIILLLTVVMVDLRQWSTDLGTGLQEGRYCQGCQDLSYGCQASLHSLRLEQGCRAHHPRFVYALLLSEVVM
jgi:hypothetical protein